MNYKSREKVHVYGTLKTPIMNSHDTAKIFANKINRCVVPAGEHEMEYKMQQLKIGNSCSLVVGLYFITMGTKSILSFFMHKHLQQPCYEILIKYSVTQRKDSNLKGSGYFLHSRWNNISENWKISYSIFPQTVCEFHANVSPRK